MCKNDTGLMNSAYGIRRTAYGNRNFMISSQVNLGQGTDKTSNSNIGTWIHLEFGAWILVLCFFRLPCAVCRKPISNQILTAAALLPILKG
jgi:hypothetical protein